MKKIKTKKMKRLKKKRPWEHITNDRSSSVRNVASTVTNLEIRSILKIKMKYKKTGKNDNKSRKFDGVCYLAAEKDMCVRIVGIGNMEIIIKNLRKQKQPLMVIRMTWCCVH